MLGDNIKRLMKENGYTQKQLAIRSGCTEASISKYIHNEREPSIKILKNLAIALGVTVDELIGTVREGEWRHEGEVYSCSICHGFAPTKTVRTGLGTTVFRTNRSNYCPHCGAKMKGE